MKHSICFFSVAAALLLTAGCRTGNVCSGDLGSSGKPKLKVGFYVDDGSRSSGVFHLAQLIYYSPQLEVTLLNGKDIREGKLDKLDMLLVPGGSSGRQFNSMKAEGAAKIREFVEKGGKYVGVCAGYHCTLDRPDRIALLPYVYRKGVGGGKADLAVDINPKGAELLGIKSGRYKVRYSSGPIAEPGKPMANARAEVLAVYKSMIGPVGRPPVNYIDSPAMLYGSRGKGKIIASSFHPEYRVATHPIFCGMIRAVSGVDITPAFPWNDPRPLRVIFYTPNCSGKARIRRMLELDRRREIDLRLAAAADLDDGILEHADALVIPDGSEKLNRQLAKTHKAMFRRFMWRGGKIFVSGNASDAFEKSENLVVVPAGQSFVDHVLKIK